MPSTAAACTATALRSRPGARRGRRWASARSQPAADAASGRAASLSCRNVATSDDRLVGEVTDQVLERRRTSLGRPSGGPRTPIMTGPKRPSSPTISRVRANTSAVRCCWPPCCNAWASSSERGKLSRRRRGDAADLPDEVDEWRQGDGVAADVHASAPGRRPHRPVAPPRRRGSTCRSRRRRTRARPTANRQRRLRTLGRTPPARRRGRRPWVPGCPGAWAIQYRRRSEGSHPMTGRGP